MKVTHLEYRPLNGCIYPSMGPLYIPMANQCLGHWYLLSPANLWCTCIDFRILFTYGSWAHNWSLVKLYINITWKLIIRSGHNFIHVTAAQLLASQITSASIVYSTICSGTDQRKHQNSESLALVRGIQRASNSENVPISWRHRDKEFTFE